MPEYIVSIEVQLEIEVTASDRYEADAKATAIANERGEVGRIIDTVLVEEAPDA